MVSVTLWLVLMAMQGGHMQAQSFAECGKDITCDPERAETVYGPRSYCLFNESRTIFIGCTADEMERYGAKGEPAEPQDVPAVQTDASEASTGLCAWNKLDGSNLSKPPFTREQWLRAKAECKRAMRKWTCADKSRVLMTAENGAKWCHRGQTEGSK